MRALYLCIILALMPNLLFAANDGMYVITEITPAVWDGTNANIPQTPTQDYDAISGDDTTLSYTLPSTFSEFTFYRMPYSQITIDTNGNIWFANSSSAYAINLPASGKGPVISAWNADLSSYVNGGVFIQHKTSPDRVVIEWQTDTFTDEGAVIPNNFEVVLFPDGKIRIDYKGFNAVNPSDYGSGVSKDDNSHYVSISDPVNYGSVYNLAGRSFLIKDVNQSTINSMNVSFSGSGTGTITSSPVGIACNSNCSSNFYTGEQIRLFVTPELYSYFSGWSSGVCTGIGNCVFRLDNNSSATATFEHEASTRSGIFYPSVQQAYNGAVSGETILAWDYTFTDGLVCERQDAPNLTILGGYDPTYATVTGTSKLVGPFTIKTGTVRVKNIVVVSGTQAAPMMLTTLAAIDTISPVVTTTSGPALIERATSKSTCHVEKDEDDEHHHHKEHHE